MLTTGRPARVAVLCSKRAPGLAHLLDCAERSSAFAVVGVMTTEPDCADIDRVRERGIPVVCRDIHAFYAERGARLTRDWEVRAAYDAGTIDVVCAFTPDLVLLDGYLYLLTSSMLEAFPSRLLNLHFSDLMLRDADSRPTYPGIRAVRDAIVDGQAETCATVHLVNSEPDGGAPIVRSWGFPVSPLVARARAWQAMDMLKAYAYAHQEWMLRDASGPLLEAALNLVTSGRVSLDVLGAQEPQCVTPWRLEADGALSLRGLSTRDQSAGERPHRVRRRLVCQQPWERRRSAEVPHTPRSQDGSQ
ncbi:MAG: formyltransferase family protein [Vicinamibacterales bacterium]